jgi:hypothetical protein
VNGEVRQINRTTTIDFKDVGPSVIEVPEEARTKPE